MKLTTSRMAVLTMAFCAILPAAAPRALARARLPLKTSLTSAEIRSLETGIFTGIPRYPGAEPYEDLAAYMPGSFAMLSFISRKATVWEISRYYERHLPQVGWALTDAYGISKSEYRESGAATLTFHKGERVLMVEVTHRTRRLLQYSLFTYELGRGRSPVLP